MSVERFPLMSINYDVTKRGNLGKRASSDWLKVMSFMLKAKITRINANLEIPLLGGLINFWRLSRFVLITLWLIQRKLSPVSHSAEPLVRYQNSEFPDSEPFFKELSVYSRNSLYILAQKANIMFKNNLR